MVKTVKYIKDVAITQETQHTKLQQSHSIHGDMDNSVFIDKKKFKMLISGPMKLKIAKLVMFLVINVNAIKEIKELEIQFILQKLLLKKPEKI